jgi:DNA invertase Pin-like site-specific DNA recombinase
MSTLCPIKYADESSADARWPAGQRSPTGPLLKATEEPLDTGTAAGKCLLGVFAEFETNLRRERQLEGIAKAKAAGVYKGRPPSIEVLSAPLKRSRSPPPS